MIWTWVQIPPVPYLEYNFDYFTFYFHTFDIVKLTRLFIFLFFYKKTYVILILIYSILIFNIIFITFLIKTSMLFHSTNSHILFIQCIDQFPQISLTKQNYDKLSQSNIEANTIFNPIINQSSDNNYKLISRNFFIQLINKFWRETIFLSASNQLSDTYIEKLKSDGLLIYSKEYKNFLSAFSKALINDRIHFSLDVTNEKSLKTNDVALR